MILSTIRAENKENEVFFSLLFLVLIVLWVENQARKNFIPLAFHVDNLGSRAK